MPQEDAGRGAARLEHAGHERHRVPAPAPPLARGRSAGRCVLHDRERHPAHSGSDRRRRQRIHHEALRQRHSASQVRASGAPMTLAGMAGIARANGAPGGRADAPYRLMVVDDSAVIRGLLTRSLEADPEVSVLVSASNGEMALAALKRYDIEIVILDIEMPVMDGLTALPKLLAAKPGLKVIIASTLTRRGADISMRALAAGAADYLTKPVASALSSADEFKRELLAKVKALGQAS